MTIRPYTVVLIRDERLEGEDELPWENAYTAWVEADGSRKAVIAAQKQAARADRDEYETVMPAMDDYHFVVVFGGHLEALLHGFELRPSPPKSRRTKP